MFKSSIPVFLSACALALSLWPTFAADSTYGTFAWALAGVVMLYGLSILIERRNEASPSVALVLEEAARTNAARVAAPTVTSCRHVETPLR
jgi:hypothetical protein